MSVSVREGGRWARRLGWAEERGCARLSSVDICGVPFVPPPLPRCLLDGLVGTKVLLP